MPESTAAVSVVVMGRRNASVAETVASFLAELRSSDELIVIDSAESGEKSCRREATEARITALRTPRGLGGSTARNLGSKLARNEVIIHVRAGVCPAPGWRAALLAPLRDDPLVAQVGSVSSPRDRPSAARSGLTFRSYFLELDWVAAHDGEPFDVPFVSSDCVAMRREIALDAGAFDEEMGEGSWADAELSLRLFL